MLLLPFKNGSNGLNVTEATHVFLIEPLLNVAVEVKRAGGGERWRRRIGEEGARRGGCGGGKGREERSQGDESFEE